MIVYEICLIKGRKKYYEYLFFSKDGKINHESVAKFVGEFAKRVNAKYSKIEIKKIEV